MKSIKKRWVMFTMIFTLSTVSPPVVHSFAVWDAIKCFLAGRQMWKLKQVYDLYQRLKGIQKGIETEIDAFKQMEEDWMGYIEDVSAFVDDMSSSSNFLDFANKLLGYANAITADVDRKYLTPSESSLLDDVIAKMNKKIEESTEEMNMVLANTSSSGTNNSDASGEEQTRFTDEERVMRVEASLQEIMMAKEKVSELVSSLKVQISNRKANAESESVYNNFFINKK